MEARFQLLESVENEVPAGKNGVGLAGCQVVAHRGRETPLVESRQPLEQVLIVPNERVWVLQFVPDPERPREVEQDGMVWTADEDLAVVSNSGNRVVALTSDDNWATAQLVGVATYETQRRRLQLSVMTSTWSIHTSRTKIPRVLSAWCFSEPETAGERDVRPVFRDDSAWLPVGHSYVWFQELTEGVPEP